MLESEAATREPGRLTPTKPGWALAVLAGISTCGFIDRIIMQVLVEPIKNEFGLTDTQIGLVAGLAFAVLYVLLGLIVARIAERRRRVSLVWIGTLLWSVATAACGFAGSFVQLALARVGVGIGEAVGLPATQSIVSDYFPPEKRTTAMSVLLLAPPIGAFLGSAAGATIAQLYGWRAAFWVASAPGVVLAVLLALTVGEPERGRYDDPATAKAEVPPISAVLKRMWGRVSLRHMIAGSTIASMVGFGLNAFLAAFLLRRFGFSVGQAGVVAGLISSVPAALSVVGAGWLADRIATRNPAAYALIPGIALLIVTPIYALAVTSDSPGTAVLLLSIAAIVQYCYLAPTSGVLQNMMHPRMRASASAVTGMIYALFGGGFGPLLVGGLSDRLATATTPQGSAEGLSLAMAATALLYVWAGLHYLRASRRLSADLALPI